LTEGFKIFITFLVTKTIIKLQLY